MLRSTARPGGTRTVTDGMRSTAKTALLIVHQEISDPGRVGALLEERGYALDVRCPNRGAPLPAHLHAHAAVVVFGGPMSANDGDTMPGIARELDFIPRVLDAETPFLGICLGAHLLARVLGAEVAPHAQGLAEIGYASIAPTKEGSRYFDGPMMVYHWHREGFDLPRAATLLAEGRAFANQAFRYGKRAYAIQFHPEVTRPIMERWIETGTRSLERPGAQPGRQQLSDFERHDPGIDRWIRRFLDQVLDGTAERPGARPGQSKA